MASYLPDTASKMITEIPEQLAGEAMGFLEPRDLGCGVPRARRLTSARRDGVLVRAAAAVGRHRALRGRGDVALPLRGAVRHDQNPVRTYHDRST